MYPVDYGKCPLNCGLCLLDSLRSKRKTGEGKGEGARKTEEEAYGEGKGNESRLTLCRPHSKLASKSCQLSLACHVAMYNISLVNEAGSQQTMERIANVSVEGKRDSVNLSSYWLTNRSQ